MTVTRLHKRFEQIQRAYETALGSRPSASVNIRDLLLAIFAAVPDTSVEEVVAMLRWSARRNFREADTLERVRRK